nr:DNA-3-methyladenine glycosylase [Geodermatophilaceae bacterium]
VLLRAGEVVSGHELAGSRRPAARTPRDLARGPARLAAALGLGPADGGADLLDPVSRVRLRLGAAQEPVRSGPRVGISVATGAPWRFWLEGAPSVSAFRPGRPRRNPDAVRSSGPADSPP